MIFPERSFILHHGGLPVSSVAPNPVAVITGASSGIGEATARALHAAGFQTFAAARRIDRLRALEGSGIRAVSLDVTDDSSMREVVEGIIATTGRIDVLVNNAGYGSYGAIEDVSPDEARRQFDVNVFGAMRMAQLTLPTMRERRTGTIINVSSMGGRIYLPLGGWYHATKFAIEALSDCMRIEVAPHGVRVVVIEPGAIRTEWSGIAADSLDANSGFGAYARLAQVVSRAMRADDMARRSSPPSLIANVIVKAAQSRRPRTRYVAGYLARPLMTLRSLLPDRWFDMVVMRSIGAN